MEKLITICLLLATTFTVNAQQKPTKEETITFLQKSLKLSIGESYRIKNRPELTERTITANEFNYHIIKNSTKHNDDNSEFIATDVFSELKWETVSSVKINSPLGITTDETEKLTFISIEFSSKYQWDRSNNGRPSASAKSRVPYYKNDLHLLVVKSKAESIKKAIERLVEIAKEENKDPF